MFVKYLEEIAPRKKMVVYPGRFGPFHNGHLGAYDQLVKEFGKENVYILTKDYPSGQDPKNPFSFKEKKDMMVAAGIPAKNILEMQGSAYKDVDVIKALESGGISTKGNSLIVAYSQADVGRLAIGGKTKKGEDRYYISTYQDLKDKSKLYPIEKHGYVYMLKTISGEAVEKISASDIRKAIKDNRLTDVKKMLPEGVYKYLVRKYIETVITL